MQKRRRLLLALPALAGASLSGCGTSPEIFGGKGPPFRPEEFFAGRLRSSGLFVTRLGGIESWFTARLVGAWDGTTLTFDELFRYEDGFEDRRFWKLRRDPADASGAAWLGEATDATGPVRGRVAGNAFHLEHELDMRNLSGNRRKLAFDQWFVRTAEDLALSRAAVSWHGVQVGVAQVAFQRLSTGVTEGAVTPGQAAREEMQNAPRPVPPAGPPARDPGRLMNLPPRR